jgi:hypothetical protein
MSLAKRASSIFPALADGMSHQRRSVATAKEKMSCSVPTDTHPAFAETS